MSGYETFNNMKPLISVCSSANVINVQGFIDELSVKFPNFDVRFFELPYNDIDHFTFRGEDVGIMILCHSINNRRFAITDVMDALYDRFLSNSAQILGKERICVIAHDFPATKGLDDPDKYKEEMETFENRQPTAFKTSSLVKMAGKLDEPVELQESNWQQLREFLMNAARSPMPKPKGCLEQIMEMVYKHRWIVLAAFIFIVVLALIISLSVRPPVVPISTPTMPTSTATTTKIPTSALLDEHLRPKQSHARELRHTPQLLNQTTLTSSNKSLNINIARLPYQNIKGKLSPQRNLALMLGDKLKKQIGKRFRKIKEFIRKI